MSTPLNLMETFATSAAVSAAMQSGLLLALLEKGGTAAELASRTGLDARAVGLVLDLLEPLGVAKKEGGVFSPSPEIVEAAKRAPMGAAALFMLMNHVPELLKTGTPAFSMEKLPERESSYSNVVDALAVMAEPFARGLASRIERAPENVLEVGCGSGVWSLALAQRFENARVTGLDLPEVAKRFVARAESLGLGARTSTLAGNFHEVPIEPKSFDLVIAANVLRIEPPARAEALCARMAAASSREVLVVDALAEGTVERNRARAAYALHLALRNREGGVYTREQIAAWLSPHGFRLSRVFDLDPSPNAAILFSRA